MNCTSKRSKAPQRFREGHGFSRAKNKNQTSTASAAEAGAARMTPRWNPTHRKSARRVGHTAGVPWGQRNGHCHMRWLAANRDWLFSGLLVSLPIAVLGWLLSKRHSERSQTQKGGANSVNVQVGGNLEVLRDADNGRPDSKSRR